MKNVSSFINIDFHMERGPKLNPANWVRLLLETSVLISMSNGTKLNGYKSKSSFTGPAFRKSQSYKKSENCS